MISDSLEVTDSEGMVMISEGLVSVLVSDGQVSVLVLIDFEAKTPSLIVRYSLKKECISFVLYCFENLSIVNFGTTGPIHLGFSAKCTLPNEDFNQIEN